MNHETILLCTGLPPRKVAELLADTLGTTVHMDGDVPVVRRPLRGELGEQATIGGGVHDNYLRDPTAEPHEQSIYDAGYDILYDISILGNVPVLDGYAIQMRETRRIFTEIIERLPFPAVHAQEGGRIIAAWDRTLGRTDFPPGTGSDAESGDRRLWAPYAHPSAPH